MDVPNLEFSLYFMGYEKPEDIPADPKARAEFAFSRRATLELTQLVLADFVVCVCGFCRMCVWILFYVCVDFVVYVCGFCCMCVCGFCCMCVWILLYVCGTLGHRVFRSSDGLHIGLALKAIRTFHCYRR